MKEKNLAYLKDSLLYLGFGKALNPALQKNIEQHFPEFVLKQAAQINDKAFTASLYFNRIGPSDLYVFRQWEGQLQATEGQRAQTFSIHKGYGVSLKEGFNLMDGRAVHKTLFDEKEQPYKAWLQLDLGAKDASGNYPIRQYQDFHLEQALKTLPLKNLEPVSEKERLVRALEKGNRVEVTVETPGRTERLWVEASPGSKSLNVYDHQQQMLSKASLEMRFSPSKHNEIAMLGKAQEEQQKRHVKHSNNVRNNSGPSLF